MQNNADELASLHAKLLKLYKKLRTDKKAQFDRVLPFNELILDRWEKAKFVKAKDGANIYDNCYIFGKVRIGKNTWVGPYTILDGSGGKLTIGDYCSISSGVQIYTHETVKWALSGGHHSYEKKNTSIGNCCYIGPSSIISMGSKIGKCSVIGAHSFVNSSVPPFSIAAGIPTKIIGKVVITKNQISFKYKKTNS